MINKALACLAAGSVFVLSGCATPCNTCYMPNVGTAYGTTAIAPIPLPAVVAQPTRIQAVGYGAQGNFIQYTAGQSKLMAMRAARVDAYRALAEQVYGYRVSGSSSVSAFAMQSDNIRTYVDTFIRGTRLVSMNAIGDGNFEAVVELELPVAFFECVTRGVVASSCQYPVPPRDAVCTVASCGTTAVPVAGYISTM